MRISIVNYSRNILGGVETYLSRLIPGLLSQDHSVAFLHEIPTRPELPIIPLADDIPIWSVAELGVKPSLVKLSEWQPDVIYSHGLVDPALEKATQQIAPAVFFAHSYYGACISGSKTFRLPNTRPCEKKFGRSCLLNYYPRRCGGLNPRTMLQEYYRQSTRLELMSDYCAILVANEHMANEYRDSVFAGRVEVVGYPLSIDEVLDIKRCDEAPRESWRLLFLGRMEFLKGGMELLNALPSVQRLLGQPLKITFAGDGRARDEWEHRATQMVVSQLGLQFTFTGWLSSEQRDALFQQTDLVVMPSLWPEPFGLVGLEAGQYGIPTVAFTVGGIPSWLEDGVNGVLASGDRPQASELAAAIVRCLREPSFYHQLCQGARKQVKRFSLHNHLSKLLPILEHAAGQRGLSPEV